MKLVHTDQLTLIVSMARDKMVAHPVRARLQNGTRDLTESELLAAAYYESILNYLSSIGAIEDADRFGVVFKNNQ